MEREREERQEFHLPPQSPNGCNVNTGPGQTQALHPGLPQGQQGLKMLEPSSIGFSDCQQGVGSKVEQLGYESVPVWNVGFVDCSLTHYAITLAPFCFSFKGSHQHSIGDTGMLQATSILMQVIADSAALKTEREAELPVCEHVAVSRVCVN